MSLLNGKRQMNIRDLKELNTRMMRTCVELENTLINHRKRPALYWIEFVVFVIFMSMLLIMVLVFTLLWPMYFRDGMSLLTEEYKEFNIHPPTMVGSFVTLNGFGICAFRFFRCMSYERAVIVHLVFEFCVMGFAALGILAVAHSYLRTAPEPKKQFESIHSYMGALTLTMHALHYIVACFVFGFSRFFKKYIKRRGFREGVSLLHSGLGFTNFLLAVATTFTGFEEHEKQIQAPKVYSYVNNVITEHNVLVVISILLFIVPIIAVFLLRRVHSSIHRVI